MLKIGRYLAAFLSNFYIPDLRRDGHAHDLHSAVHVKLGASVKNMPVTRLLRPKQGQLVLKIRYLLV